MNERSIALVRELAEKTASPDEAADLKRLMGEYPKPTGAPIAPPANDQGETA